MWIRVPYDHSPEDFTVIEIAPMYEPASDPPKDGWRPAFRDTLDDGTKVVQIKGYRQVKRAWVRDSTGVKSIQTVS